jgi:putative cardiolipin synthase
MKSYLILILFIIISCATHRTTPSQNDLPTREPNNTKTCYEIAQNIITPKKSDISTATNILEQVDDEEIDLVNILKKRNDIKSRYHKITESIRDFELHSDLPINGKIKLVLDPIEGYLAKIMMIRNAKLTLDLSYYIFKDEDSTNALLHEVRMAIKRGVKVRVLIDSQGSISNAPFYDDLKALVALSGKEIFDVEGNPTGMRTNVEAVLFNPVFNIRAHVANWYRRVYNLFASPDNQLPLATFTINRRLHDKILLADAHSLSDSIAMLGGRNLEDVNYGIEEGEIATNVDAEILIKGLTLKNENNVQNILEEHYNKIYFYLANKNFKDFLFKTNKKIVRRELKNMREASRKIVTGENAILKDRLAEMEQKDFLKNDFEDSLLSIVNEIQNLSRTKIMLAPNGPQNKKNGNSLMSKIYDDIDQAQETINFVSPYFWIPEEDVDILIEWAKENPKRVVNFFTCSINTGNRLVAQAMVDHTIKNNIMKKIKNTSVEKQFGVYSYGRKDDVKLGGLKKYGLLHTKLVFIDDKKFILSTSNLDPMSRHINSEVGVSSDDLPLNSHNIAQLKDYIQKIKENSTPWGESEWQEIKNHPANKTINILEEFVTKIIVTLNLIPLI